MNGTRWAAALLLAGTAWAGEARRVFVLEKRAEKLLCSYTNEQAWREAAVDTEKPQYVAIVERQGGRVVRVFVERYTEDSQTYDEYTIGAGNRVRELRREIAHVTSRVRREQVWRMEPGRARLVNETWREWRGERTVPADDSLRDFAGARVVTRTAEFPFWRLAGAGGARCAGGTMTTLEASAGSTPSR